MAYVRLLRPGQWTKNVFVFAGLIFGRKLTDIESVVYAVLGFICFCLVSSAVYVMNDIHDRNEDRLHPRKRTRPIASGAVSVPSAAAIAAGLLLMGLGGAALLDIPFFLVAAAYVVLQLFYTFWLKHAALVDVIMIGMGFVMRAVAGAVVVHVAISPWLIICTFTLCLFMGFSKRRCELNAMAEQTQTNTARHRKTLIAYTPALLNHMTTMAAGIAVVSFMLYATDERTVSPETGFGTPYLIYTLPLVVYAIFRFALLVEHGRVDGPSEVLLRDRPFQISLVLWGLTALLIVYAGRDIQAWLVDVVGRGSA